MNITIVGTGYVGLVTGAAFSEIGHNVLCVDNDERKIAALLKHQIPIHEDGLDELIIRNAGQGRLRFSTSIREGTEFAEVIFVAVGTPPGYRGQADMSYIEQVGRQVAENMTSYKLLVEKSTVPVKTHEQFKRTMVNYMRSNMSFDVASNPEFLREGAAVHDVFHPDRIVVGVESEPAARRLREIYAPIVEASGCPYLEMSMASAELTKHASNSFLAMKISYINAVSRICELTGADIEQVALGMGLDKRIGPAFLKAGVGFGGSCFPKDLDAFVELGGELGYPLDMLKSVKTVNAGQREHLLKKLQKELWVLQDKTIAVLGLAFKPGTDDTRAAPALFFAQQMIEARAKLRLWDPAAGGKFRESFPAGEYFDGDPLQAAEGADAVLILTDWPVVKGMDLDRLRQVVRCPVVVDGRNCFAPVDMAARGFVYHSMGRPSLPPCPGPGEAVSPRHSA